MLWALTSIQGCRHDLPIQRVYILEYGTNRCLTCTLGDDLAPLLDVVAFRDSPEIESWIRTAFRSRNPQFQKSFHDASGEDLYRELSSLMTTGFVFDNGATTLSYSYERVPIDTYVGRATLADASGKGLWKGIIPTIRLPIYPLFCHGRFFYIDGATNGLVIGAGGTGKILEVYVPPGEADGFGNPNLEYRLPFYRNGFIYLEGTPKIDYKNPSVDPRVGPFSYKRPPKVYVIRVDF